MPANTSPAFVVIFRATLAEPDERYAKMAETLRKRALQDFGCLEFLSMEQDSQEIALSYWPDRESIEAWKADSQHRVAQHLGRNAWYRDYRVELVQLLHHHRWQSRL